MGRGEGYRNMTAERVPNRGPTRHSVAAAHEYANEMRNVNHAECQQISLAEATKLLDQLENLRHSGRISDTVYARESSRIIAAALDHSEADIAAQITFRQDSARRRAGQRNTPKETK